ncbi:putative 2-dehydro-3-deoxy-D-pentonate aldolase YjhH [subsurface metagenome]
MRTNEKIEGVYCVLSTPFKEDESLDEARLRSHIDRVIEGGVDGVIISGSTGEFASLSEEERERLIKIGTEHVNGRVPVVVGSMAPSTRETIRWSKFAEDLGAAGLLVVNPYYGSITDEALYQHYKAVAEAVNIPVMPYNNTDASGNDLKPEIINRLVDEGKIAYVKACVDSRRMQIIIGHCGDRITLFVGVDDLLFQCFTLGGVGCVSGGSNVVPGVVKRLYNLIVKEKNIEAARELWYKYAPLAALFEAPRVWIPNIKAGCEVIGDPIGPPRRPLLPASDEVKEEIRRLLKNLGAL